jgi:mono/diheme cytochrome c family protein
MKREINLTAVLLAFASLIVPADAQSVDPTMGRDIVEKQCSACHKIDSDSSPRGKSSGAPSMMDISRMPSTTELSIKVFLRTSHSRMPNIILSADEIDSIASYIVGLKSKK